MKQIKGIVILTIFIVLVCVIFIVIFSSKDSKNEEKMQTKEEISIEQKEEKIKNQLNNIGKDFYENYYNYQVGSTDEERSDFLSKYESKGIKINLDNLSRYDEKNAIEINKFVYKKAKKVCDKSETKVIIYPISPYDKKSYKIDTKIVWTDWEKEDYYDDADDEDEDEYNENINYNLIANQCANKVITTYNISGCRFEIVDEGDDEKTYMYSCNHEINFWVFVYNDGISGYKFYNTPIFKCN